MLFFYAHQYHQRGVDETYTGVGEHFQTDNGETGMRRNSTF